MKKKELLRNKTNGKEFNMRNKNGKKITALVLAALIAVTALACGCSKDNKKASQNSSVQMFKPRMNRAAKRRTHRMERAKIHL